MRDLRGDSSSSHTVCHTDDASVSVENVIVEVILVLILTSTRHTNVSEVITPEDGFINASLRENVVPESISSIVSAIGVEQHVT